MHRPRISPAREGRIEEYLLAQTAIKYFSRDFRDMDHRQLGALMKIYDPVTRRLFMRALGRWDMRVSLSYVNAKQLLGILNGLFFFGSLCEMAFEYAEEFFDDDGNELLDWAGLSFIKFDADGRRSHSIKMHPVVCDDVRQDLKDDGISLQRYRLGTILHEMVHCYIAQHACKKCEVKRRYQNHGEHGCGFQLVAKAIEDQALRLLGLDVDLGRLDSLLDDREESQGRGQEGFRDSAHDVEVYGFLEPLGRRRRGSPLKFGPWYADSRRARRVLAVRQTEEAVIGSK
jgi:hypothetical protein